MGVSQWPKVVLKGGSQAIPHVCPNCGEAATVDMRYCYIRWWDVLRPTRFYQSFSYCGDCAPAVVADMKHQGRTDWMLRVPGVVMTLILGMFVMVLVANLIPAGIKETYFSAKEPKNQLLLTVLVGGCGLVPVLTMWRYARWSKKSGLQKHPQTAKQAVWGAAAYYTGSPFSDLFRLTPSSIYRAARPEWLAALVRANPEQVDDATYRDIVGQQKPVVEVKRPFAA